MSRQYETTVTVTINGDEKDVAVRAHVMVEPNLGMGGSWGAALDGDADVRVQRRWVSADTVSLGDRDMERIEEALCDMALNDDRDFT